MLIPALKLACRELCRLHELHACHLFCKNGGFFFLSHAVRRGWKSTIKRALELPVKHKRWRSRRRGRCWDISRTAASPVAYRHPGVCAGFLFRVQPLLLSCSLFSLLVSFCRSPSCAAASTSGRGDPTSGRSPPGLSRSLSSQGRRNFYSNVVVTKKRIPQLPSVPVGGFHLPLACPGPVCVHIHTHIHSVFFPPLSSPLVTWQYLAFLWESFKSKMPVVPPCCWWEVLCSLVCLPFQRVLCSLLWFLSSWCFELSWGE